MQDFRELEPHRDLRQALLDRMLESAERSGAGASHRQCSCYSVCPLSKAEASAFENTRTFNSWTPAKTGYLMRLGLMCA